MYSLVRRDVPDRGRVAFEIGYGRFDEIPQVSLQVFHCLAPAPFEPKCGEADAKGEGAALRQPLEPGQFLVGRSRLVP